MGRKALPLGRVARGTGGFSGKDHWFGNRFGELPLTLFCAVHPPYRFVAIK
jgi:hypothetical protein